MAGVLWAFIVLLAVLWVVGLVAHIGGGLIHIAIVVALILLVFNIFTGRGARV